MTSPMYTAFYPSRMAKAIMTLPARNLIEVIDSLDADERSVLLTHHFGTFATMPKRAHIIWMMLFGWRDRVIGQLLIDGIRLSRSWYHQQGVRATKTYYFYHRNRKKYRRLINKYRRENESYKNSGGA